MPSPSEKSERVALTCPQCGGDQFIQPENADLDAQLKCAGCGLEGTARDLIEPQAREKAKRFVEEALSATFGKRFKR